MAEHKKEMAKMRASGKGECVANEDCGSKKDITPDGRTYVL